MDVISFCPSLCVVVVGGEYRGPYASQRCIEHFTPYFMSKSFIYVY